MNLINLKKHDNSKLLKYGSKYYFVFESRCYEVNELGAVCIKYTGKDITSTELAKKIRANYNEHSIEQIKNDIENFYSFCLNQEIIAVYE